jgi:hypothetical protein
MIAARRDQRERAARSCQLSIGRNPQQCAKIREIQWAPDVIAREYLEREQMTSAPTTANETPASLRSAAIRRRAALSGLTGGCCSRPGTITSFRPWSFVEPFHKAVLDLGGRGIGPSEVLPHQVESRVEEVERCLKSFGDLVGCGHELMRGEVGPGWLRESVVSPAAGREILCSATIILDGEFRRAA